MKVLVTGAAGYIGSQVSYILQDHGIKHINLDNLSTAKKKLINGKTKLHCENILKFYAKKYKFNYSILRYFNVVGADSLMRTGQLNDSGHLFMNIFNSIKKQSFKVKIFGSNYKTRDKTAIRDFIDVEDLSLIHLLILKKMIKKNKSYKINSCSK